MTFDRCFEDILKDLDLKGLHTIAHDRMLEAETNAENRLWSRVKGAVALAEFYLEIKAERDRVASGKVTCEDCGSLLARF